MDATELLGCVGLGLVAISTIGCLLIVGWILAVMVGERVEDRRAARADERFANEIGATLR